MCESGVGMCSFPVANVSFIKNGHEEVSYSRAGSIFELRHEKTNKLGSRTGLTLSELYKHRR